MKTITTLAMDTIEEMCSACESLSKHTDAVEFRLDALTKCEKPDLAKLITCAHSNQLRCIMTAREMTHQQELLNEACNQGSDYIDIEIEAGKEVINYLQENKKATQLILSYHDFKSTPSREKLEETYTALKNYEPDKIKIVTMAQSILDNFEMFHFMEFKEKIIAFCMGLRGHLSRIFAPKFGSWTYCCPKDYTEAAPGQISIHEMNDVYNIQRMNSETKMLGVIGEHAENSRSKYMHNDGFKRNSINMLYVPLKVRPEELKEFVVKIKAFGFSGCAVTVPHKVAIQEYMDEIDETAQQIGAVNTIVNQDGNLVGYNTDYIGAIEALKEHTQLFHKKVLVLGAGGASRAFLYGLNKEEAHTTIINRTHTKAHILAKEFGATAKEEHKKESEVHTNDIIVNTTSVGMNPHPNACPLDINTLKEDTIVMDMVYNPLETELIKGAKNKKCLAITGDRMLIYQAMGQFQIWCGLKPQFKDMTEALARGVK